ncbi:MAG: hypothetical protein EMLJLAPB_00886 [Candidatus Argoarchaeum ethanivorans]|uniref:Uncharacterized protein n=1 Tax=Candidatus Argoarchaeum ethanivorans TaxID=2608793 RepID=A0A811TG26_9EURY|nr:MAG: hypothetical protein EMLJLAPB_00886 [Candidatus Argoarchaeum ethanivorans]
MNKIGIKHGIFIVMLIAMVGTANADEEITQGMIPFTTNEVGERYFLTGDLTCANITTSAIERAGFCYCISACKNCSIPGDAGTSFREIT